MSMFIVQKTQTRGQKKSSYIYKDHFYNIQRQFHSSRHPLDMQSLQLLIVITLVALCYSFEAKVCRWDGVKQEFGEGDAYFNEEKCTEMDCIGGQWNINEVGCRYKSSCKAPGQEWTHDCITYVCRKLSEFIAEPVIIKRGCKLPNGTCVPRRTSFRNGCHIEKCKRVGNTNELKLQPHTYGCQWHIDGQCYPEGKVKSYNCDEYECKKVKGGEYKFALKTLKCEKTGKPGCAGIGETWGFRFMCLSFTCKKDKDRQGEDTTRVDKDQGCRYRSNCYALHQAHILDPCNKLVCTEYNGTYRMKLVSKGCRFGNKCRDRGSIWKNLCRQLECPLKYSRKNFRYAERHPGCPEINSNKCRDVGDSWIEWSEEDQSCYAMKCNLRGLRKSADGTCYVNGSCYKNGDTVPGLAGQQCTCDEGVLVCNQTPA